MFLGSARKSFDWQRRKEMLLLDWSSVRHRYAGLLHRPSCSMKDRVIWVSVNSQIAVRSKKDIIVLDWSSTHQPETEHQRDWLCFLVDTNLSVSEKKDSRRDQMRPCPTWLILNASLRYRAPLSPILSHLTLREVSVCREWREDKNVGQREGERSHSVVQQCLTELLSAFVADSKVRKRKCV